MKEYTAEEWLPSASGLGESPLYRASDDTFFFVDIKNHLVHIIPRPSQEGAWSRTRTFEFDEPITRLNVVTGRDDLLAVQTKLSFAVLSLESGKLDHISKIHHAHDISLDAKVRMNDGGIDAKGRWWAGTMALDEKTPIGKLWYLERGQVHDTNEQEAQKLVETPVPNGPVWSPDDRIMYTCETPHGRIHRYDYDVATGQATNKRLFAEMEDGGMPDGLAVDVEDHVWTAANSQGKLVRFSPEGEAVATCMVPGANMCSCPTFGGSDMKTLFITSITAEESSGNVYRVCVDVPGIQRHEFRMPEKSH